MRLMFIIASILILGWLSGCSSTKTESVIQPVEVKVPVPVSCVPKDLPAKPTYSDSDEVLVKQDGAGRYQYVIIGRTERQQRLDILEPIIEACR